MVSIVRVVAVAAVGLGASLASAAPQVVISKHTKTVEIKDPAWGITALTIQIPDNWTFEGVLLRDPYCGGVPTVAYRISSPDGLAGFQSMPAFTSHYSDDKISMQSYERFHCKIMQPMSPADWLQYVAPAVRPNPTIGKVEPTFDAAQIEQNMQQYNDRGRANHVPVNQTGGGVHSRLEYALHGTTVEENLRVVVSTFQIMTATRKQAWNTNVDVSGLRAPKGQLDSVMKQLGPMIQTAAFTPDWIARQQRQMAADNQAAMAMIKRQGDQIRDTLKRNHDAFMQQQQQSFDHAQQADRDRQDAMHRSAVAWTLYAGDEQIVRNPQSGEVSRVTSTAGRNVHQDQTSGAMVASDDPNFDPSYYVRGQWTQLENVDPLAPSGK
ncbi:MAG TPA: hypothetical protein VH143_17610 [Kofleriaceae bacterium]|jgi:hypothetical protein|nr:hypothetical protein [Kofleriaceae bacterium]